MGDGPARYVGAVPMVTAGGDWPARRLPREERISGGTAEGALPRPNTPLTATGLTGSFAQLVRSAETP